MAEIKNLSFGIPKRKRFSIDGDETRFVELDTGDTGIVNRWNEIEGWFNSISDRIDAMDLDGIQDDAERSHKAISDMTDMDREVRSKLNYLFDADVCTPIAGENGSLLRPVNGEPLFYVILEVLIPLYEAEIKVEAAKSQKRLEKHTAKYRK